MYSLIRSGSKITGGRGRGGRELSGWAVYPQNLAFIRAVCVGAGGVRWYLFVWYLRLTLIDTVTPLFIHYHRHNLFSPRFIFFNPLWHFSRELQLDQTVTRTTAHVGEKVEKIWEKP